MENMIKQRRQELGLTQQELADKLKITVSWLSKIENGKRIPNLALAFRIADALGSDLQEIFLHRK